MQLYREEQKPITCKPVPNRYQIEIIKKDMLRIYHNPHCKKSRAGLQFLQGLGKPFEIVEYLKNKLAPGDLEKLLVKLNKKPVDIIRKQEPYYKENLKNKQFEDHEWIHILIGEPKLIQRPIIETRYKAIIGDPVEAIEPFLSERG